MKRLFLLLALAVIAVNESSAQRIVENINRGWGFNYGWEFLELTEARSQVNVPHTYNLDALGAVSDYYRGMANYTREIDIKPEWRGKKQVYLRFGAVGQNAEVYVNSRRVGEHHGGYTAFGFDITPFLNYGGVNTVWVRVSNAHDLEVMPLVGNFNIYGGIYRDVELIVTPITHISHSNFASSGVNVTTLSLSEQKAVVNISATVEGTVGSTVDVNFMLKDRDGVKIDSTQKSVKIGMDGKGHPKWAYTIVSPKMWNGVKDPYMYSVEVSASTPTRSSKQVADVDAVTTDFGLRTFSVNGDNEFILNGEKYPLHGVTKLQDFAMYGSAVYDEQLERDLELICEMGANCVRLAYYPQSEKFIEMCDKAGIIVWSEIPFIGPGKYRDTGFNNSENFKDNGENQLRELMAQQFNNPSVMFLGLFNEISQRGDDPLSYIRMLNSIVKDEDPQRLTVAASNQDGEINFVTDLIGFNLYLGWDSGQPQDVAGWTKSVRSQWPKLKVGLSEYGAGASPYQHEANPVRPVPNSYWHPEEWQTKVHYEYLKTIKNSGAFWGTFASSLADWGAAHLKCGDRAGINDMGLVTFDRATKKDAFYLYKANWNKKDKFAYITSRRFKERKGLNQDIMVFSPLDSLSLEVNGVVVDTLANDGMGSFNFLKCAMNKGENTIEARGISDSLITDKIVIKITE